MQDLPYAIVPDNGTLSVSSVTRFAPAFSRGRRAPVTRTQLIAAARNIANTAYVLEIAHGSQHPMVTALMNREAEALEEARALDLVELVHAGGARGIIAAAQLDAINRTRAHRSDRTEQRRGVY